MTGPTKGWLLNSMKRIREQHIRAAQLVRAKVAGLNLQPPLPEYAEQIARLHETISDLVREEEEKIRSAGAHTRTHARSGAE